MNLILTAKNFYVVLNTILFTFCALSLKAQINLSLITERLTEQLPQEKVYLSFDKPQYTKGDNINFKAFLMSARTHASDSLSGVLHVNVLDARDKEVLAHKMYQVSSSFAIGTLETQNFKGDIIIQAFTEWMLNFPSDYHFNKKINITDFTTSVNEEEKSAGYEKLYLSFFPEGGNLVTGLASKVAFKAVNENGNSVSVNGVIVDDKGEGVVVFKDEYLGMGSCSFTPVYGKKYSAQVKIDNNTIEYPLPSIADIGYVMAIDNLKDKDNVKVSVQTNMPDVAMPKMIYLLAHTRGNINHAMQLEVLDKKNKAFVFNVPKEKLDKDGIVHITLFNDRGQPLAERLIFVENKKKRLSVKINTDKESYKKREKVVLNIEIKDTEGKPCEAEIAFTVINADKIKTPQYSETLLSYILLRSDLGINIEMPSYYLEDTSRRAKRALDHLMMTNGWRRFVWKEILEQDRPPHPQHLPETGLVVRGNVSDNKKAITNASLLVTLFNETEGNQPFFVESDKKGNFKLENVFISDSAKVFMQVTDKKKKFEFEAASQKAIAVKAPNEVYFEPIQQKISDYLAAVKDELASQKMRTVKEIELQTLEVKSKKIKKADSRAIYGTAGTVIEVDQGFASGYNNIIDYLNGRGGINVYEKDNGVYFRPFRGNSSIEGQSQPLVMIDGFAVDAAVLKTISMVDVERVDIIRGGVALYGARGANGVVNVLTKTNSTVKYKPKMADETDLQSVIVKGYSIVKEFYSPDYGSTQKLHDIPDNRTVIYWSPYVKTDKSGKTQIIFYNSDDAQTMRIQAECWQKDGKLGMNHYEYSVKQ